MFWFCCSLKPPKTNMDTQKSQTFERMMQFQSHHFYRCCLLEEIWRIKWCNHKPYFWWFRNPANQLRLVDYPIYQQGFYTSQVVSRMSEPSTVSPNSQRVSTASTKFIFFGMNVTFLGRLLLKNLLYTTWKGSMAIATPISLSLSWPRAPNPPFGGWAIYPSTFTTVYPFFLLLKRNACVTCPNLAQIWI